MLVLDAFSRALRKEADGDLRAGDSFSFSSKRDTIMGGGGTNKGKSSGKDKSDRKKRKKKGGGGGGGIAFELNKKGWRHSDDLPAGISVRSLFEGGPVSKYVGRRVVGWVCR